MRRLPRPAAAPGLLRRPAAAVGGRRVRRKPAGEAGAEGEAEKAAVEETAEEVLAKFFRGEEVEGVRLAPGVIGRGDWLVAAKGSYYQQAAPFAIKVEREELDSGERELVGVLTGTESEPLLRFGTAEKPCRVQVHLCSARCQRLRENPNLSHTRYLRKLLPDSPKTWEANLLEETETGVLQAEAEAWRKRQEDKKKEERRRSSSTSPSAKKRRRKKKKKKAKRTEGGELRAPEKTKLGGKTVAKKTQEALFQGTGLDPIWKNRKKILKLVKKKLRRSRESSSSSGSSTSSTSSDSGSENILEDRSKLHRIAAIAPGVLAAQGVANMKEHLTQVAGTGWEEDRQSLPPLLGLYHRTYMMNRLSGGVSREFSTLCWVGDMLLQGRASEAMDALMQRLKSLELTAAGTNWATSQKLELVPPPAAQIGSRAEIQVARKEARLDQQVLPGAQSSDKGKAKGKEKGREKGKEKGKGKSKEGDGKKAPA